MNRLFIVLALLVGLCNLAKAQSGCANHPQFIVYGADENLHRFTPIKRIRVVFHVFRRNDGSGNRIPPSDTADFLRTIEWQRNYIRNYIFNAGKYERDLYGHQSINYKYHTNFDTSWSYSKSYDWNNDGNSDSTIVSYINQKDTKIIFRVDSILFHYSTYYAENMWSGGKLRADSIYTRYISQTTPLSSLDSTRLMPFGLSDSLRGDALHIFVGFNTNSNHDGVACGEGCKNYLVLDSLNATFEITLAHELGHNLGLRHTFESSGSPANYSHCWHPAIATRLTTDNVMDHAWNQKTYGPTFIPNGPNVPRAHQIEFDSCQIGRMHQQIANNVGSLRDILIKDYCEHHPGSTITIHNGENIVWTDKKLLWGDVVVAAGGTLTISCEVSLPKGSTIIVQRGGTLIVNGGVITNLCDGQMWQGVTVWGNPNAAQTDYSSTGQGRVILMNGAVIENARYGVFTSKPLDFNYQNFDHAYNGGVVQATGAVFRNNFISVTLWPNGRRTSASSFTGCTFEATAALKDLTIYGSRPENKYHMIIWGNSGIPIQYCTFKRVYNSHVFSTGYSYGISALDARLDVRNCAFLDLNYGIVLQNPNPTSSVASEIRVNDFLRCHYPVRVNSSPIRVQISGNKFNWDWQAPGYISNTDTDFPWTLIAVFATAANNLLVQDNQIRSSRFGVVLNECSYNAADPFNQVRRNHFNRVWRGVHLEDENHAHVSCNTFDTIRSAAICNCGVVYNRDWVERELGSIQSPSSNYFKHIYPGDSALPGYAQYATTDCIYKKTAWNSQNEFTYWTAQRSSTSSNQCGSWLYPDSPHVANPRNQYVYHGPVNRTCGFACSDQGGSTPGGGGSQGFGGFFEGGGGFQSFSGGGGGEPVESTDTTVWTLEMVQDTLPSLPENKRGYVTQQYCTQLVANGQDTLVVPFMESLSYDFARRWLVPRYVADGEFVKAQNTHALLVDTTASFQAENDYWGIVIDLGLAGKNEKEADSTQVVVMETIADGATPTRHFARSFLHAYDERLLGDIWTPSIDSVIHYRVSELILQDDKLDELRIEVYPNPSSGQVSFKIDTETAGNLHLEWHDLTGRRVLTEARELDAGTNELHFDRSHWPDGLYLWRARIGVHSAEGKLMLQSNR